MDYRKEFEACFEYVEAHLKDKISIEDMANYMGYSLYHFCRIFYAYQGMSPMEYVLERRLLAAIVDLQQGKKVIDVSLDYCFETASGFSKAFRKRYGQSPTDFTKYIRGEIEQYPNSCPPIKIDIKEIEPFDISGYSKSFDYDNTSLEDNMIAFWDSYENDNIEESLYATLNPKKHGEFGIVIREGDDSTHHSYLLGVRGKSMDSKCIWTEYRITGGRYAVFTTAPIDMVKDESSFARRIRETWRYIFSNWFQTVDFKYDVGREAFEYYDERCHYRRDSVMEIYIPIVT